jgi:hypothetical protein
MFDEIPWYYRIPIRTMLLWPAWGYFKVVHPPGVIEAIAGYDDIWIVTKNFDVIKLRSEKFKHWVNDTKDEYIYKKMIPWNNLPDQSTRLPDGMIRVGKLDMLKDFNSSFDYELKLFNSLPFSTRLWILKYYKIINIYNLK